ncbi:MAG: hypothetical protein ACI3YH_09245 [Eubacteriales bacterium]
MGVLLISEQLLINLLKDVRKAQSKLYNAHCSRQLINDLDWDIRAIEQTTYERPDELMKKFMDEHELIYDQAPWEE